MPSLSGAFISPCPVWGKSTADADRDDVVQCFVGRGKETADIARRLPDALLVLYERDAHKALAVLAKAEPRRDCDIGLLDQELRELDAAERPKAFRDRRPGKHAGGRRGYRPSAAGERI